MKIMGIILGLVLTTVVAAQSQPSLQVFDQTLIGGVLTIDTVTAAESGFVVVHAFDSEGEVVLTPPLGLAQVGPGTSRYLQIPLNPQLLSEYGYERQKNVLPMLHVDANGNGEYDFPDGPDVPVMANGEMVVAALQLSPATNAVPGYGMGAMLPLELGADGLSVTVPSVTLAQPGFVVLHSTDSDGQLVVLPALGHSALLGAGTHEEITVWFNGETGVTVGDEVVAMLHFDDGNGLYEFPDSDAPVTNSGEMILLPITLR